MTGMDVLKCPVCKKGNLLTNELHLGYKARALLVVKTMIGADF
jgi:uncharacterized protein YbaR (Trm112 family)